MFGAKCSKRIYPLISFDKQTGHQLNWWTGIKASSLELRRYWAIALPPVQDCFHTSSVFSAESTAHNKNTPNFIRLSSIALTYDPPLRQMLFGLSSIKDQLGAILFLLNTQCHCDYLWVLIVHMKLSVWQKLSVLSIAAVLAKYSESCVDIVVFTKLWSYDE